MGDFAKQKQVIFECDATTYAVGANVECRFSVKSSLTPDKNDWVGLFKVGWSSSKDAISYLYIPYPLVKSAENDCFNGSLLFLGTSLPKDDGEYYHFVYFDGKGYMKGASGPFNFRIPRCDELIEEDMMDDSEMLMITTKQMKLDVINKDLMTQLDELKKDRDALESANYLTNEAMKEHESKLLLVQADREVALQCLEDVKRELEARQVELGQVKEDYRKRLDEAEDRVRECDNQLSDLRNQLDKSRGDALVWHQEKELLVSQLNEVHGSRQQYSDQVTSLFTKLAVYEEMESEHKQKLAEIEELKAKVDAGETRHSTALQEIEALNATLHNLNQKVESLSMANDNLNLKYREVQQELVQLNAEKENLIELFNKEKNGLISSVVSLQMQLKQFEVSSLDEDRYYALQTAYSLVKDELNKTRAELDNLKSRRDGRAKLLNSTLSSQERIAELEEKLKLSEIEWRKMAAEKNSLAQRLDAKMVSNTSSTADLSKPELEAMVEQLGCDLDVMSRKKQAYKIKYHEEKQRAFAMKDHYVSEVAKLERDLQLAKSAIDDKIESPISAGGKRSAAPDEVIVKPKLTPAPFVYPGFDAVPLVPERIVYPGSKNPFLAGERASSLEFELNLNRPGEQKDSSNSVEPIPIIPIPNKRDEATETEEDTEAGERFHDAVETPQVLNDGPPMSCCICHQNFGAEDPESVRNQHVNQHLEPSRNASSDYFICPVCGCTFHKSDFTAEYVEGHINQHFME